MFDERHWCSAYCRRERKPLEARVGEAAQEAGRLLVVDPKPIAGA
jgi:hypothetical protein